MNAHKIERFAVDSSNLKSIGYDGAVCVVEFGNGHLYAYPMPQAEFDRFAAAESKGRYFNQEIRSKVPGEKLTGQCAGCGKSPTIIAEPCPSCGGVVRAIDKVHKDAK